MARKINTAEPAVPQYLKWLGSAIFFDWSDHPDHFTHLGRFPLVVDPLVYDVRLTKVLMDGGSGLNILYVKTHKDMKVPCSEIKPTGAPFHGNVPGMNDFAWQTSDIPGVPREVAEHSLNVNLNGKTFKQWL